MDEAFIEEWNRRIDELPVIIINPLAPSEVNGSVVIFRGKFQLQLKTTTVEIDGDIYYSYRPKPGVRFRGDSDYYNFDMHIESILISGRSFEHGNALITHIGGSDHLLRGIINNPTVLYGANSEANKLIFSLPNFQDMIGLPVRSEHSMMANRLIFEDDEWLIEIDQAANSKDILRELKLEGDYGVNYNGCMTNKLRSFDYGRSVDMITRLGQFISFLNGRRCFPAFIQAFDNKDIAWNDYSSFHADAYREEYSWIPQMYSRDLSDLWKNYMAMSNDADDHECLDFLIHWYVEANNNSGFAEGSVVFLQNAFELLFNWQVVEKDHKYTAKQAGKIPAAEKLRELMVRAQLPTTFPPKYQNVVQLLQQQGFSANDFPDLFTQMRNSIVHANDSKRKKLNKIPSMTRFHIRQMGLHCLELLMLHVLGYQGKYANRTSENIFRGGNDEDVPWVVKTP